VRWTGPVHPTTLALALALAFGNPAEAHKFDHPKSIRLGITPGAVAVAVTYDVDPGDPSRQLRGLFDRDGDLQLGMEEQARLTKYLEDTATLWLKVEVDGLPVTLARRAREVTALELPVGSSKTLGISLVYTASVSAGRLRLRDRDKDARTHVPVVVDLAPGLRLRSANQGEWHPRLRQVHRVMVGPELPLEIDVRPGAT